MTDLLTPDESGLTDLEYQKIIKMTPEESEAAYKEAVSWWKDFETACNKTVSNTVLDAKNVPDSWL